MARRKQNPIKDIGNQVGSWLGGAARVYADITDRSRDVQPGRLPQVQAALDATRAIGKVVDTAAGGVGSAVVSDARRMAKTGSSTPSALYKTAAVNLAAGAVGAGAAQVAAKTVGKVVNTAARNRYHRIEVSIQPTVSENVFYHAQSSRDRVNPLYTPVHSRIHGGSSRQGFHAGTHRAALERFGATGGTGYGGTMDRYEIVDPTRVSTGKFVDADNFGNRMAYPEEQHAQTYMRAPTPENKVITYVNKYEDAGSTSVVIPKNLTSGKNPAVVYRGTMDLPGHGQAPDFFYSTASMSRIDQNRARINQAIANRLPAAKSTAAAAAALAPKKKSRGGGKNKR